MEKVRRPGVTGMRGHTATRFSPRPHKDVKNMKYYSTNGKAPLASLEKAVVQGLAEDRGLYMPERIVPLSPEFLTHLGD